MRNRSLQVLLVSTVVVISTGLIAPAEEIDLDAAIATLLDPAASTTEAVRALGETRKSLRDASATLAAPTRSRLCAALSVVDSPASIRRLSMALSEGPSDDAIDILLNRFTPADPERTQLAVCFAMRQLVRYHAPRHPQTEQLALGHLSQVVRLRVHPKPVVAAALLGIAVYRSEGFERLQELSRDPQIASEVDDVLCTALGETGDPRALPILRATAADEATRSGIRIQALRAIGLVFANAEEPGAAIDPAEREACYRLVASLLDEDTPAQLFQVALEAAGLAASSTERDGLRATVSQALRSTNDRRRRAAMRFLYTMREALDDSTLALVQSASANDSSPIVRDMARALLQPSAAEEQSSP